MQILIGLTVVATGLLAGALLAEARILVPYWKTMPATEFARLHHTMAASLFRFYAPLTVVGTVLPIATWIWLYTSGTPQQTVWILISALCAAALLGFYFAFFRAANVRFASETDGNEVEKILSKWALLHSIRTAIAVFGFAAATVAGMS